MEKKIVTTLVLGLIAFSLTGCQWLSDLKTKLQSKASETAERAEKTAKDIKDQVEKTGASVKKKVDDVKSAAKEVGEALDAIDKLNE